MAFKGIIPWNKGMSFMAGTKNPMYGVHRYGEASPHYNKPHSQATKDKMSIDKIEYFKTHENPMKGKKRPDLAERNRLQKGKTIEEIYGEERAPTLRKSYGSPLEKHPLWQGGKSFEPYDVAFNEELKNKIKEKNDYVCQICFEKGLPLDIHHIDYNKLNSEKDNLTCLCKSCHTKTNFNRKQWITIFQEECC